MKLGNKIILILYIFNISNLLADDKITTTPLINLNEIKPSFEEVDEKIDSLNESKIIKEKNKNLEILDSSHAILIGLDKITAKSTKIKVKLDEVKNFGPLEIKVLKCGKVRVNNKSNDVAYLQVKDLTKNENEKFLYSMDGHLLTTLH